MAYNECFSDMSVMPIIRDFSILKSRVPAKIMRATLKERILSYPFYFLPHHAISWCMYKLSRIKSTPVKNMLIRIYTTVKTVRMDEAVIENKYAYESLNAFFTREIKSELRPITSETKTWACPVDGFVSQAGNIKEGLIFQAKGCEYSLLKLVGGNQNIARLFMNGSFSTLYLSPSDYHRVHMPVSGELKQMIYIPGRLFSVATHTVNSIPDIFTRNERCVCVFDTEDGPLALILVGAMNVSAIETVWNGILKSNKKSITNFSYTENEVQLTKGQEMGRFNLGSTVIVLSGNELKWVNNLIEGNQVKMGLPLGTT